MAEPLKNMINKKIISSMAAHFNGNWSAFNDKGFVADATNNLESLELKERTDRITDTMINYFPKAFKQAGKIIVASLGAELSDEKMILREDNNGISGWAVMALAHYVALQGQHHFDLSMELLKELTKRASSEFAIRYFLMSSPEKTLKVMKTWATDSNHHVRRLASEGCRPRLPWSMNLPRFIKDPKPVIELLELLKDDEQEYVRRSVANNLNDISKDHPDAVAALAGQWLKGASENRKKLIRHGCRTLIKKGHKKTLKLFGYESPKIKNVKITLLTAKVVLGDALKFNLSLSAQAPVDQSLMIDYIIHHQKANGATTPKVFKWRTITLSSKKSIHIEKKHNIKKITTRVYYPGEHRLEIMINGESVGSKKFNLLLT